MDFISFLGGLAIGAAGAALIDNLRSGQAVVSGPSGNLGILIRAASGNGSFRGHKNLGQRIPLQAVGGNIRTGWL